MNSLEMLEIVTNEEEKYDTKIRSIFRMRRRIRALIRLAYFNFYWLEDLHSHHIGDNVKKNIKLLTGRHQTFSLLQLSEKATLNKRKKYRTEEEKEHLCKVLGHMRCFKRYPDDVRKELTTVAFFSYFGPKRVIVCQDDPSYYWYYILAGEVNVIRKQRDDYSGTEVDRDLGQMVPGQSFGEACLIHDLPRNATIKTLTDCEFLVIKKTDFNRILKSLVLERYDLIQQCMSQFSYFDAYNQEDVTDCCIVSKLKSYEKNDIVLSSEVGIQYYTYFIVRGKCEVIQQIMYTTYYNKKGEKSYKVYKAEDDETFIVRPAVRNVSGLIEAYNVVDKDHALWVTPIPKYPATGYENIKGDIPKEVHRIFIYVYTHTAKGCFNIGENLANKTVMCTSDDLFCLLIPTTWLYQKNIAYVWTQTATFLNSRIPSADQILDEFIKKQRWAKYKQKLFKSLVDKSRVITYNHKNNIPLSIRLNEDLSIYNDIT